MRLGGVAANYRQVNLRAGLAAQQTRTFINRRVARGLAVDRADVIAGDQSRLGGGRAVACRDDAEVILPGDFETGLRGTANIALVDDLDLVDIEVGAVGIESVGKA